MAGVPSGLSFITRQETKKKRYPWRDSNRVPPECEPTALSLDQPVRGYNVVNVERNRPRNLSPVIHS
jgi:hypothetical protein